MTTEVVTDFADGQYRFWLPMPQILSFEREHGPLLDFWGKLTDAIGVDGEGKFHFIGSSGPPTAAIRDLIRLALIGGNQGLVDGQEDGVGPTRSKNLVDDYIFPVRPLAEGAALAFRVVDAAVRGVSLKKNETTDGEIPNSSEEAQS